MSTEHVARRTSEAKPPRPSRSGKPARRARAGKKVADAGTLAEEMSAEAVERAKPVTRARRGKQAEPQPAEAGRSSMAAKAAKPAKSVKLSKSAKPSKATKTSRQPVDVLVIGGTPTVDLLPPEVKRERKAQRTRRSLALGVGGVAIVVLLAVGGAWLLSFAAQSQLSLAQGQTTSLLAQQAHYQKARTIHEEVGLIQAAQEVGASTEIAWTPYLDRVQATLPDDVTITAVSIGSANPLAVYQQSTDPLQGARIATLTFTATSPQLPTVPDWLKSLATLPGFEDATPGSVSLNTTTGQYTVTITMHLNTHAFDGRFNGEGK